MASSSDSVGGLRRILRLTPGTDPTVLSLSPQEGFLLSRIDGHTPWHLLREIGGMDADEVDLVLDGWLAQGIVEVAGVAAGPRRNDPPRASRPREGTRAAGEIDESALDSSLDIDMEVQRRILEFEANLDRPYHELLGVAMDADAKTVKKAYFKLSREFHPDRYFRRNIAHYEPRLEHIFKKILEAHEILSDPKLRDELRAASGPTPTTAPAVKSQGGGNAAQPSTSPPKPLSKLERLRQRMPYKLPEKLIAERRAKAMEFRRSAEQSARMGRLAEAASTIRVAISFDPHNPAHREALVDVQGRIAEVKAAELLRDGMGIMNQSELSKILRTLEEVLLYRPHDPALNARAAAVCVGLEQGKQALEYAGIAVEHNPEVAAYHTVLGLAHQLLGDLGHAKQSLDRAIELDPNDAEARSALAALKVGRRGAATGGMK